MPRYLMTWEEVDTLNVIIEAGSKKEALDKFWNQDYDVEDVATVSVNMSDSGVEVEEI